MKHLQIKQQVTIGGKTHYIAFHLKKRDYCIVDIYLNTILDGIHSLDDAERIADDMNN